MTVPGPSAIGREAGVWSLAGAGPSPAAGRPYFRGSPVKYSINSFVGFEPLPSELRESMLCGGGPPLTWFWQHTVFVARSITVTVTVWTYAGALRRLAVSTGNVK